MVEKLVLQIGANRCLIATASKDDMKVIAVVLGANTTDVRFEEGKKLLEYALQNYAMTDISEYMNWYINIEVYKGNISRYEKKIKDNIILPLKAGELEKIYIKQNIVPLIKAPAMKGNYLGNVEMYIDTEKIYDESVILDEDISKNDTLYYIKYSLKNMFNIKLEL